MHSDITFDISLRDVHIYARHGVFSQEQTVGNEFILNLTVKYRYPLPEVADELSDTISYADLYEIALQEMQKPSKLLEHVAWRIATDIRRRYPFVISSSISIEKTAPPIPGICGSSSVTLTL